MCSEILKGEDKMTISLYAVGEELGLGIGIILNWRQDNGNNYNHKTAYLQVRLFFQKG